MTYNETVEWMFRQLPMYQHQGASAYKKDLTNTHLLARHLGHPENVFKSVHIAGTNGKGSVSSMLASIFQEAGYKTGLYTSPHLKDYRERIRINGIEIPEKYVQAFIEKNKSFFEQQQLSFFEMTVGLAFQYFKDEQVDIAIIETGMGGRLDSTNIITPLVSVITNIGMDHKQFLGNTLPEIASEKAGIIKKGIPIVVGEYTPETKLVFTDKAAWASSPLLFAADEATALYESDLKGDYQEHNIKTVLKTITVLQQHFTIAEKHIKNGLLNVVKNTGLKGRWQQINTNPTAICDTAHNSHGLNIVLNQVKKQPYNKLHVVLGVVNDKDLGDILPLFPKDADYYFCRPNVPRGLEASALQQEALQYGLHGKLYPSVAAAYDEALKRAGTDDFIYIGGSTFVVAEIL